jgi:hypothetical protein
MADKPLNSITAAITAATVANKIIRFNAPPPSLRTTGWLLTYVNKYKVVEAFAPPPTTPGSCDATPRW